MNEIDTGRSKNKLLRNNESHLTDSTSSTNTYIHAATSDNTRRVYQAAIRRFELWGGRLPTNQQTLVHYLNVQANQLNPRTLAVHLTAISQWHQYQALPDPSQDPSVRKTLKGIQRLHGTPKRKAKALRLEHLAQMLSWLLSQPESLKRTRDLALISVGFFGAFRRSELVAIKTNDLSWEPEGLLIHVRKSKTDQSSEGIVRALPNGEKNVCPVAALKNWLTLAKIDTGPVFRSINRWQTIQTKALYPGSVTDILKSVGNSCGLDFVPELSSHSFRRGLSTSASREKIDFELIKKQGGWKSDHTVWEYIDEGQALTENACPPLMTKVASLISKQ